MLIYNTAEFSELKQCDSLYSCIAKNLPPELISSTRVTSLSFAEATYIVYMAFKVKSRYHMIRVDRQHNYICFIYFNSALIFIT